MALVSTKKGTVTQHQQHFVLLHYVVLEDIKLHHFMILVEFCNDSEKGNVISVCVILKS
jgi:hypothetical protein